MSDLLSPSPDSGPAPQQASLISLCISNFKRFPELTITLRDPLLVIGGPNGSGKTQVLWALLLYFRAYNARVAGSQHFESKKLQLAQQLGTLLSPSLESMQTSFTTFVHTTQRDEDGDVYGRALFQGTFDDSTRWTAVLHTNGVLDFRELPASSSCEKLRYAFVAASYSYCTPRREPGSDDDLLSHAGNARGVFATLPMEDVTFIRETLAQLFGTRDLRLHVESKVRHVYVTDSLGCELEIQHHGAALQKTLAILTYFAALSRVPEVRRFFLVDEIESHLYPAIVSQLITVLEKEAVARKVHIVVTSISEVLLQPSLTRGLLCLSALDAGHATLSSLYHHLGHKTRRIVVVDGGHDALFVKKLLDHFYPDLASSTTLHTQRSFMSGKSPEFDQLCDLFKTQGCKVVRLMDPELFPVASQPATSGPSKIDSFFWELPCVESFFILDSMLQNPTQAATNFLVYANTPAYYFEYIKGLVNALGKAKMDPPVGSHTVWTDAIKMVTDSSAADVDWPSIVRLVRGHTCVGFFGLKATPRLIAELNVDRLQATTLALLRKTIDAVAQALS